MNLNKLSPSGGGRRPGCLGAASTLQMVAMGILAAGALYGLSRAILHEPTPPQPAAVHEAGNPAAGSATTAEPTGRDAGASGQSGVVGSSDPSQGIAPTLPDRSLGTGPGPLAMIEPPRAPNGASVPLPRPEELIGDLTDIRHAYANAPKENDAAIRRILRQLGALGPAAVPAIREYLSTGEDLAFELVNADGQLVDSNSLRLALLELLNAMGGADATDVLIDEIQNTGSPQEIQAIARMLDERYPGEYRKLAMDATYDLLGRIAQGELAGADTAPLFHLLAEYGDEKAIAELEKPGSAWPYYRAVGLAEAPDGTGMPGLIRVSQEATEPALQQLATQLLAQSAARYPQAAEALLDGLEAKKLSIPDHLWPKIAQALTGNYELGLLKPDAGPLPSEVERNPYRSIAIGGAGGPSIVYITDVEGLSPEERQTRLALVNQLLDQDLGPAAKLALGQARKTLER